MREEDIKYINELEERVKELEEENERMLALDIATTAELNYVDKQNKRYREAIKVAVRNMKSSDNLGIKFALDILNEALEGGN